ncbi:MAG: response regulator [Gammaproteobacteria bacterium]|nr:response regulator [Gammaproteobacteria bacterium]
MTLDLSRSTVLLADDDALARQLATEILEIEDFEVTATSDGEQAWAAIDEQPRLFDAVVLDGRMPGLSGFELLERVKRDPRTCDIPVVMLSGLTNVADVTAGIRAGAYYYVTKPYDPDLLVSVLRAAIDDRNNHAEVERKLATTVGALPLLTRAEFEFRTVDEAQALAGLVANVAPEPSRVVTGLWELMINAIEHGNLGIGYEEKTALMNSGQWHEEIANRQRRDPWRQRVVRLVAERDAERVRYYVRDEGEGFTPEPFLDFDPLRLTHAHGRGIAMACQFSFDAVHYLGRGNEVEAIVELRPGTGARKAVA